MMVSKIVNGKLELGREWGRVEKKQQGKCKIKWMQIISKFNRNSTDGRQKLYAKQKYVTVLMLPSKGKAPAESDNKKLQSLFLIVHYRTLTQLERRNIRWQNF